MSSIHSFIFTGVKMNCHNNQSGLWSCHRGFGWMKAPGWLTTARPWRGSEKRLQMVLVFSHQCPWPLSTLDELQLVPRAISPYFHICSRPVCQSWQCWPHWPSTLVCVWESTSNRWRCSEERWNTGRVGPVYIGVMWKVIVYSDNAWFTVHHFHLSFLCGCPCMCVGRPFSDLRN